MEVEVIMHTLTMKMCELKLVSREITPLEYHQERTEKWEVLKGNCMVDIDYQVIHLTVGDNIYIPMNTPHRIIAEEDTVILETQVGVIHDDDKYIIEGVKSYD